MKKPGTTGLLSGKVVKTDHIFGIAKSIMGSSMTASAGVFLP
jgi:hypothetical protein